MKITDRHAGQHAHLEQHVGKILTGHKIVVEGFYFSNEIEPHTGHSEKKRVKYREEFTLRAREHKLHGQGALGHILSDKVLLERLSSKDPNFRAIQTHVVVAHENLFADAPKEGGAHEGDESAE